MTTRNTRPRTELERGGPAQMPEYTPYDKTTIERTTKIVGTLVDYGVVMKTLVANYNSLGRYMGDIIGRIDHLDSSDERKNTIRHLAETLRALDESVELLRGKEAASVAVVADNITAARDMVTSQLARVSDSSAIGINELKQTLLAVSKQIEAVNKHLSTATTSIVTAIQQGGEMEVDLSGIESIILESAEDVKTTLGQHVTTLNGSLDATRDKLEALKGVMDEVAAMRVPQPQVAVAPAPASIDPTELYATLDRIGADVKGAAAHQSEKTKHTTSYLNDILTAVRAIQKEQQTVTGTLTSLAQRIEALETSTTAKMADMEATLVQRMKGVEEQIATLASTQKAAPTIPPIPAPVVDREVLRDLAAPIMALSPLVSLVPTLTAVAPTMASMDTLVPILTSLPTLLAPLDALTSLQTLTILSKDVSTLSSSMSRDMSTLSSSMSKDVESLSSAVSSDVASFSVAVTNNVATLSTKLAGEIASLSTAVEDLSTHIRTKESENPKHDSPVVPSQSVATPVIVDVDVVPLESAEVAPAINMAAIPVEDAEVPTTDNGEEAKIDPEPEGVAEAESLPQPDNAVDVVDGGQEEAVVEGPSDGAVAPVDDEDRSEQEAKDNVDHDATDNDPPASDVPPETPEEDTSVEDVDPEPAPAPTPKPKGRGGRKRIGESLIVSPVASSTSTPTRKRIGGAASRPRVTRKQ